ncbi:MAG: nickel-responsive transcriptional regulator NikR [Victivallales bacterium]|nr:nickel-responsive transcriptional regulator NikR [Victivallales bacterium]
MPSLTRLSFSIEDSLFNKLDKMVRESGYANRSEFIRDMIRDQIVAEEWRDNQDETVGTITLIYDHKRRELSEKLTDLQHSSHNIVLASTHVHLTHEICAEMIMVKGNPKEVKHLSDKLKQQKGVLHSGLIMGTTGINLK